MYVFFGVVLLSYLFYRFYQYFFPSPNIDTHGKYVLISGCDTGFGHESAIRLDRLGFHLLAGVYNPENIDILKNKLSSKATIFRLDITKQDDIDAAYDLIKNKTNVLHALVNNAGISSGGNIDWSSMESFRQIMEVNFFGHVAMTKKFLSLLTVKRNSRVINLTSMCGYISLPGLAAYTATKYALEAFSDCLRREMFPWNLRVSIIEPGTMRTAIIESIESQIRDVWQRSTTDAQQRWGEEYFNQSLTIALNNPFLKYAENPEKVVQVIVHAVTSTTPYIRYRPGWQSSLFFYPVSLLPTWLADKIICSAFNIPPAGIKDQTND